jgi:hypothetical protein
MYVERVPNRNSRPAILLREAWREGQRIRKRTLANLTDWPQHKVDALRRLLKGEALADPATLFITERSRPHGHVEAVLKAIGKLELRRLLGSRRCREQDLVIAMVAERLLHPCSKLATTRLWHTTTLAEELEVEDANVDELYAALDWLLAWQERIETGLAKRHLREGGLVLYDVSTSYYEGRSCPLAQYGHSRDGRLGLPVIAYGILTDSEGRPVAVEVYPGSTGDPTTVPDQVEKLRARFGMDRVVLVGDRGMLTQAKINTLREHPGLGWISALRSPSIRALVVEGHLQPTLFDQRNLAEIYAPEFPGERLIACMNPLLAQERRRKRQELLEATERELAKVAGQVARRRRKPMLKADIGVKVGRVINRFKVAKHFELRIEDAHLSWQRRVESIRQEEQLDGIYVLRTSEPVSVLGAEDVVRSYKSLSQVERAFRCLKGIDLKVRPIRHRTEAHVRAHILLCMLAYYVEWHLRKAWAALLFEDEQVDQDRRQRDPVAPAKPSAAVVAKKASRLTTDGLPAHSFETLLAALACRVRNTCRVKSDVVGPTFRQVTEPDPTQARASELLEAYPVA